MKSLEFASRKVASLATASSLEFEFERLMPRRCAPCRDCKLEEESETKSSKEKGIDQDEHRKLQRLKD